MGRETGFWNRTVVLAVLITMAVWFGPFGLFLLPMWICRGR